MKSISIFFGSYVVSILILILSVLSVLEGTIKLSVIVVVIDALIVAFLVAYRTKFIRAAKLIKKRLPEPNDAPMDFKV